MEIKGMISQCYGCNAYWGDCTCGWKDVECEEGFEFNGVGIVDPSLGENGTFMVDPAIYYGKVYLKWKQDRIKCGLRVVNRYNPDAYVALTLRESVNEVLECNNRQFSGKQREELHEKIAEDKIDGPPLGPCSDYDDEVECEISSLQSRSDFEIAKEYDERFCVNPDAVIREMTKLLKNVQGNDQQVQAVEEAIAKRKKELGQNEAHNEIKECECGAVKHKFSSHSTWCPARK